MGQAAVDLPDPLEKAPAPLSSADDLLSQMAGQEIDRLLAEADGHPETDDQAKAANSEENVPSQIGDILESARKDGELPPVVAGAGAGVTGADPYADQMEQLLKELTRSPKGSPPAETPPPVAGTAPAARTEPAAEPEIDTSVAEREALTAPVEFLPGPAEPIAQVEETRLPLYVRLLELINAPFSACPDLLRDTLGKVAILTLMNAVGVLLYLVLFRHR